MIERAFALYPRQPFDLAATAEYVAQYRDRQGTDRWDARRLWHLPHPTLSRWERD